LEVIGSANIITRLASSFSIGQYTHRYFNNQVDKERSQLFLMMNPLTSDDTR